MGSHKKRLWDLKHKIPFDFPSSERRFWGRVTTGVPKGQVQRWVGRKPTPPPPPAEPGSKTSRVPHFSPASPEPGLQGRNPSRTPGATPRPSDVETACSGPRSREAAVRPETRFLGRGSGDTPARSSLSGKVRQGGGGPDWDGWMQTGKVSPARPPLK